MAGGDTVYRVSVLYEVKDKAKAPLGGIAQASEQAARSTSGLTTALKTAVAAVAGFGVFRMAKSAFIDFNNSVEQSTISLAAQEKMLLGGTWASAMSNATGLFADYQRVAKESVGTTTDFLTMHAGIASSAYRAGLGMKQLKEMTIGATVASVALGERADMVALDIKQMLAGDVTSRDRTAQILLASQGVGQDAFNKMNQKKRNQVVVAALNDPALKSAAKAMGQSFAGVTSTLKDNIQIALGKIGLPLFKSITEEVKKWNEWIDKNPEKIKQFATDFTSAIRDGFEMVKKIASFIVENKDLLMALAKAYMVGKGVSMAAGAASGIGGGMMKWVAKLGGAGAGSLGAVAGAAGALTAALAAGAAIAVYRNEEEKKKERDQENAKGGWGVVARGMGEYIAGRGTATTGGRFASGSREARVAQSQGANAANLMLAERMIAQAKDQGLLVTGKGGRQFVNSAAIATMGTDAGASQAEIMGYIAALNQALGEESRYLKGLSMTERQEKFGAQYEGIKAAFVEGSKLWEGMTMRVFGQLVDPGFGSKMALIIARGYSMLPGMGVLPNIDDTKKGGTSKEPGPKINLTFNVTSDDPDRFSIDASAMIRNRLKNGGGAWSAFREA